MAIPVIAAIGAGLLATGAAGSIGSGMMDRTDNRGYKVGSAGRVGDHGAGRYAAAAAGRAAPTVQSTHWADAANAGPGAAFSGSSTTGQGLGFQAALAAKLADQADGKGPSLASMQMQQGVAASLKAQQAAAASQRGRFNAALAMRGLGSQAADMQQQAAGQSAMLRMQEQMTARQQLAGLSSSMRGQELGEANLSQQAGMFGASEANKMSLANAGFGQQAGMFNADASNKASLANMEAELRSRGMNDEQIARMLGIQTQVGMFNEENARAYEDMRLREHNAYMDRDIQTSKDAKDRRARFWGGFLQAGGSMMQSSDERVKEDVKDGSDSLRKFYKAIGTHSYKYKDSHKDSELGGRGTYVSPMAQELEKTDLGKSMVKDTADGKVVDYGKGFGAMLAGQAHLFREIETLKRALKGKR